MTEYNGYNTYKEHWLSQRLKEVFANAPEMQPDTIGWIWEFCMERMRYFDIEADIAEDRSKQIWLKVVDALMREMQVIMLMSRVTVIHKD